MRTTVDIQHELLQRARAVAVRSRRTLGDVVDDALRALFAEEERAAARCPPPLPVARPSALAPGIDLSPRTIKELLAEDDR